jgi:hypothetical protein
VRPSRRIPAKRLSPRLNRTLRSLHGRLRTSSSDKPIDQPTDITVSASLPSPTPSKGEDNWTPQPSPTREEEKPSPTPTQQPIAASSSSSTLGSWDDKSTDQEQQQPSQTYQSTSEYWVANAVESEVVSTSAVPLTTSSVYRVAGGETRTSTWVYSTTYSTVRSPDRTITASGKVGTKVTVVAGSSTATTLTATNEANPTSDASNSSDGSLSKGGIAGMCRWPLHIADMQRRCRWLSRCRRGDPPAIVPLLRK